MTHGGWRFPSLILDLTGWYHDRKQDQSLPDRFTYATLEQVYHELGLYPWIVEQFEAIETSPSGSIIELPSSGLIDFFEQINPPKQSIYLFPRIFDAEQNENHMLWDALTMISTKVHQQQGLLFVRVQGCAGPLLKKLSEAGVDCIEGVCCPPQGDTLLMKARGLAGEKVLLWGGLPQESLLSSWSMKEFKKLARYVSEEAYGESNVIVGAAGGVPAEADIGKIQYLADLYQHMEEVWT